MWGRGILGGVRVMTRNLMRRPIAVRYPYETVELAERARWAVAPRYDAEGKPRCTACMACVRACPDHVLVLESTRGKDGAKHIERYSYDIGACMMCGLCVEACPSDAIEMSHDYELARTSPDELSCDLLRDVDAAVLERPRPVKPKRPAKKRKKKRKAKETADE